MLKGHIFRFADEDQGYAFIEGYTLAGGPGVYDDLERDEADDCWKLVVETDDDLGYGDDGLVDGYHVHLVYGVTPYR